MQGPFTPSEAAATYISENSRLVDVPLDFFRRAGIKRFGWVRAATKISARIVPSSPQHTRGGRKRTACVRARDLVPALSVLGRIP